MIRLLLLIRGEGGWYLKMVVVGVVVGVVVVQEEVQGGVIPLRQRSCQSVCIVDRAYI